MTKAAASVEIFHRHVRFVNFEKHKKSKALARGITSERKVCDKYYGKTRSQVQG